MDMDIDSYGFHTDSVYLSMKKGFNFDDDMAQGFGAESQKKRHEVASSFNASQLPQSTPNGSNSNQGDVVIQIGRRSTQSGPVASDSVHVGSTSRFSARAQMNGGGNGVTGKDNHNDRTSDEEFNESNISLDDPHDEEDFSATSRQSCLENSGFLWPVTVKQMIHASVKFSSSKKSGLQFTIEGRDVEQVYAVAQIVKLDYYTKYVIFVLEDGSAGKIKGKFFIDDESRRRQRQGFSSSEVPDGMSEMRGCRHLDYISLIGSLGRYPEGSTINELNIKDFQKVRDFHQIFHHLLNVMYVKVAQEKGEPPRKIIEKIRKQRVTEEQPLASDKHLASQYRTRPETPQTPRTPQKVSVSNNVPTTPVTPTPSRRQSENPFENLSSLGLNSPSITTSAQMERPKFRPSNSGIPQTPTPKHKPKRTFSRTSDTEMDVDADRSFNVQDANESSEIDAGLFGDINATTNSSKVFSRMDQLPSSSYNESSYLPRASEKFAATYSYSSAEKQKAEQLDPYSHLTHLEREIILFLSGRRMRMSTHPVDDYDEGIKIPGALGDPEEDKLKQGKGAGNDYSIDRNHGVHVRNITTYILSIEMYKYTPALTIDKAIQRLYDEGHIYSTINEMHYNVNDCR